MRMNISVPDKLAEQVRGLDLPISGICQKALGAAVEDAQRRAAFTDDLDAIAARLRGTLNEETTARYQEAVEDGWAWAKEYATASDLKELADDPNYLHPQLPSLIDFHSAKTGQDVISVDVHDAEERLYWDGFVDGAVSLWDAVRNRL